MENLLIYIVGFLAGGIVAAFFWRERIFHFEITARESELRRKMYELAILKEVGERIGYSLDVEKIVDVITGSLNQFISYSTVSYILVKPEGFVFKIDLEKPVGKKFVDDVRVRMEKSLEALLDKKIESTEVEERMTGALLLEETLGIEDTVRSFFNIPLVINEKVVGLLTVADVKEGLYKEKEMTILYKVVAQASQAVTKLEHVIKIEEAKLNAMVESLPDGVVMVDRDFRIMVVNPAAKKYLSLENDPEVDIFDLIESLGGKFDLRARINESIKLDTTLLVSEVDIGKRFFKIFVSPVKGESDIVHGKVLGGVVVLQDVTAEKEAEKMKEDFTAMMVHELRSPLDGIKKMGEMMHGDDIRLDKKAYDEYIQMIYESSSGMLELVNDLLDVAHIQSGNFSLSPRAVKIRQIIVERFRFVGYIAKDRKITLETKISDSVPEEVTCDSVRIEQVFDNLFSNAIKYSNPGGKISVNAFIHKKGEHLSKEAEKEGVQWFVGDKKDKEFKEIPDCVVSAVTDNGVGIDEIQAEKLFDRPEKFGVVRRNQRGEKSMGLGLIKIKGIIEAHGGIVGAVSRVGEGSTFYFTINI
jgi:signal transduction histidine kinase